MWMRSLAQASVATVQHVDAELIFYFFYSVVLSQVQHVDAELSIEESQEYGSDPAEEWWYSTIVPGSI